MSLILLLSLGYFVPTIVAIKRGHPQVVAIIVTNILLGWTFLGWVVALIWSVTAISPNYVKQPISGGTKIALFALALIPLTPVLLVLIGRL
jgi:hypothetical protein